MLCITLVSIIFTCVLLAYENINEVKFYEKKTPVNLIK